MLYLFNPNVTLYRVKMSMLCNVQTTNLTFVGKKKDIQFIFIPLRNYK